MPPADDRPRVEVRMPDDAGTLTVPLVQLEQRADGRWAAVVGLPRYVDLTRPGDTGGSRIAPWEEHMPVPPGDYRPIPGQDYRNVKRVPRSGTVRPTQHPGRH
ncbi:hypothetical protein [Embleya sp. NPDC020630]|uniref:hypothetical protein n=1 Tax=Embleya sp. NPDC020630 TaxID=3363979 RepID=UPI0037B3ACF4